MDKQRFMLLSHVIFYMVKKFTKSVINYNTSDYLSPEPDLQI